MYLTGLPVVYYVLLVLLYVLGAYGKYMWVNDIPVNSDSANLLTVFYSLPSLNDTFRLFFSAKPATTSKFK